MDSKWRKLKQALGLNLCPRNHVADNNEDDDSFYQLQSERRSNAALLSPPGDWYSSAPSTPVSSTMKLSKSLSRSSSKKTCSICLSSMRRGDGQAIFTAECSHTFHFHCIASSVKHGNQSCPVCRAKWKEIPLQVPNLESSSLARARINPLDLPQNNDFVTVIRHLPRASSNSMAMIQAPEPPVFDDDESLGQETDSRDKNSNPMVDSIERRRVRIKTYTEVSSVARFSALDSFDVLLHLKAPCSNSWLNPRKSDSNFSQAPRAPIDLVTILDISGSMAGTKLALLKRAMGFVIQNLGPNDRLSVIAFSSTARRLFPLRKMSESGKQQALQSVNSLVASGGTNIAEGLRKGAKIVDDRREKNTVSSIILLSDGQDTYTVNNNSVSGQNRSSYDSLLPLSIKETPGFKIPVHTFGFGMDHDASLMHFISEFSGGMFSFIETEGVIQDAFAQCIGGLLSVVIKDLQVKIECVHPKINLHSLKVGSYPNRVLSNQRSGIIDVGDLYADEERDFLVSVNVPYEDSSQETLLLTVNCSYDDPLAKESVASEDVIVKIKRTQLSVKENVSLEVNRQQNRTKAAEAMSRARTLAENGDLNGAVSVIDNFRKLLSETVSAKSRDGLCAALDAELKGMQERMTSRQVYEASGRAYILSGLSSHSWQRATARGDSIDRSSLIRAYQTPSMVEMVTRSQAALLGSPSTVRPVWSFGSRVKPR